MTEDNRQLALVEVSGSHGSLTVRPDGTIVERDPRGYQEILRFDTEEFKRHYGELNSSIDILDIGYWYKFDADSDEEKYEAPEPEFRAELAALKSVGTLPHKTNVPELEAVVTAVATPERVPTELSRMISDRNGQNPELVTADFSESGLAIHIENHTNHDHQDPQGVIWIEQDTDGQWRVCIWDNFFEINPTVITLRNARDPKTIKPAEPVTRLRDLFKLTDSMPDSAKLVIVGPGGKELKVTTMSALTSPGDTADDFEVVLRTE